MGGILLISHGRFAEGLKESLEMLCGECPQVFTACLESMDGLEAFSEKFEQAYQKASKYGNVAVFCDLMGGTPCNAAVKKLLRKENQSLIAGMNLPMLMSFIFGDTKKESVISEGKNAIVDVLENLSMETPDCDEYEE